MPLTAFLCWKLARISRTRIALNWPQRRRIADLVAYIIAWGVRGGTMNRPARPDLASLGESVLALRYFQHRADFPVWGFAVIDDLRPREEKSR